MISVNSYNPAVYNKNKELKRKDELRFDGYGQVIEKPYNFYKDFCVKKTLDSNNCLGFLLEKVKGNQKLSDAINFLNNSKIVKYSDIKPLNKEEKIAKQRLIRQNIINRDGTIIDIEKAKETDKALLGRILFNIKKQQLIDHNIIKQNGDIIGLNKQIIIKDGKDKLPDLRLPDTNIEILGGKFDHSDHIEGKHVVLRKNVNFPGSIKAKTLELYNNTYLNTVKEAESIHAYDNSIIDDVEKTGSMQIDNKAQIFRATVTGWLIALKEAAIRNAAVGTLKLFGKANAANINANKIIAHDSSSLDVFSAKYFEKYSEKVKTDKPIVCKKYPMVTVEYFDTKKVAVPKVENTALPAHPVITS